MNSVRKYGKGPYQICLLHGGPGVAGTLKPVAERLSKEIGILECLQTKNSVSGQLEELRIQIQTEADPPVILAGHSWGAWLGYLFAARNPSLVEKLILINAGAFENKFNGNQVDVRFSRLTQQQRDEAEKLMIRLNTEEPETEILQRFGKLMDFTDSYDPLPDDSDPIELDIHIYKSVWTEASELRNSNSLINDARKIQCPVVAIHGDYDPHPSSGVEIPLSERIENFKMILLEKCGHTPWKEKHAREVFFEILTKELTG